MACQSSRLLVMFLVSPPSRAMCKWPVMVTILQFCLLLNLLLTKLIGCWKGFLSLKRSYPRCALIFESTLSTALLHPGLLESDGLMVSQAACPSLLKTRTPSSMMEDPAAGLDLSVNLITCSKNESHSVNGREGSLDLSIDEQIGRPGLCLLPRPPAHE